MLRYDIPPIGAILFRGLPINEPEPEPELAIEWTPIFTSYSIVFSDGGKGDPTATQPANSGGVSWCMAAHASPAFNPSGWLSSKGMWVWKSPE